MYQNGKKHLKNLEAFAARFLNCVWPFGTLCINSFMTEVPIIWKPVHWFAEQINGLVSIWQGPPSWKCYRVNSSFHFFSSTLTKHSPFLRSCPLDSRAKLTVWERLMLSLERGINVLCTFSLNRLPHPHNCLQNVPTLVKTLDQLCLSHFTMF